MTPSEEQLVILVEALASHDVEQHAVVRNLQLAKRLAACNNVSVGPLARSPATAYCLMPDVDVAHAHDSRAIQVGSQLVGDIEEVSGVISGDDGLSSQNEVVTGALALDAQCPYGSPHKGVEPMKSARQVSNKVRGVVETSNMRPLVK